MTLRRLISGLVAELELAFDRAIRETPGASGQARGEFISSLIIDQAPQNGQQAGRAGRAAITRRLND